MKLVRCISLFIVCIGLFIIGCFAGAKYESLFYPKPNYLQSEKVSVDMQKITADTKLYVYAISQENVQDKVLQQCDMPERYIGMGLQDFIDEMQLLNSNPSLADLKKGFVQVNVHSFSNEKVELYKYYKMIPEGNVEYILKENQGNIVVYLSDGTTVYQETDIPVSLLPKEVQIQIKNQKRIWGEKNLYDFLESYSS